MGDNYFSKLFINAWNIFQLVLLIKYIVCLSYIRTYKALKNISSKNAKLFG